MHLARIIGRATATVGHPSLHGMKLLVECGMLKAAKGITTIEEVLRVARAEDAVH